MSVQVATSERVGSVRLSAVASVGTGTMAKLEAGSSEGVRAQISNFLLDASSLLKGVTDGGTRNML